VRRSRGRLGHYVPDTVTSPREFRGIGSGKKEEECAPEEGGGGEIAAWVPMPVGGSSIAKFRTMCPSTALCVIASASLLRYVTPRNVLDRVRASGPFSGK